MPEVCRRYYSETTKSRFFKKLHGIFYRAGIETHAAAEGREKATPVAGFHALRHSFVSACARAGIPEGVVRQWVGHGSLMVTRLYTHWSAADAAGITRALPDFG
jgi:integrase